MSTLHQKIHEYYNFILPLVLQAGKIMKEATDMKVEFKQDIVYDLVTVYDRKIEEVLIHKIKQRYPEHKHIGEEETSINGTIPELTDDPTWIIDPIDGTQNFVRYMPVTCISVGMTINKEQVLGIVFNPYLDELFTAIKGEGAYLNGKHIYTSGCTDIQKSVMNFEISVARKNEYYYNLCMYRFKRLITVIQGFRSLGCAVLGICYIACGRTDAYQLDALFPWDVAAATLILTEAGGHLVDTTGKEFDLMNPNFLAAATKELSDQYMALENQADQERENDLKQKKNFVP